MPATLVGGALSTAVLSALQAAAAVTALVPSARIVDETPVRPVYPFLLVESSGETPFNTLGAPSAEAFGSLARISVRVVSQYRGDSEIQGIAAAVRGALDGAAFTLAGFPEALLTWESTSPILRTAVNLTVTREQVSEYALTVHQ